MILKNVTIARCPWFFIKSLKRIKSKPKTLYLTFDDGPTPGITENVLGLLGKYDAKATFFCIGKNADENSSILEKIKEEGHTIGNHSYSHLNAFKVSNKIWIENVIRQSSVSESKYFRPPYGNLIPWKLKSLSRLYKVILWDVLTYDFRRDLHISKIKSIILNKTRNGSIIVFHDSVKAAPNMIPALKYTLEHFTNLGYKFEKL